LQALLRKTARPMIEIPLTKVRIAPSPLWETATTKDVTRCTRRGQSARGVSFPALISRHWWPPCVAGCCPAFLTPPPDASGTDFGGEHTATNVHRRSMDNVKRIILPLTHWIDEIGHRSAD
jgi:hypothetical protein